MENITLDIKEKDSTVENESIDHSEKAKFVLSLSKFEGPIDVLLDLARRQKVDLKDISIVELVDQYLNFIHSAKNLNLELAAEYMVMAAWLTYLKSKILLPNLSSEEDLSGEELSELLAFQLRRLETIREVSKKLFLNNLLGRDKFIRGMPEKEIENISFEDNTNLNDLLISYSSALRRNNSKDEYIPSYKKLESVESALIRLNKMIGEEKNWKQLSMFLPDHLLNEDLIYNCSVLASTFSASLELVKSGEIEISQKKAFGEIMIRKKK